MIVLDVEETVEGPFSVLADSVNVTELPVNASPVCVELIVVVVSVDVEVVIDVGKELVVDVARYWQSVPA